MVLFAIRSDTEGGCPVRLGVTASRKVGGAVVRARTKRRIRELFRTRFPARWDGGLDVVVNARRGCAEAPWSDLVAEFDRSVERLLERLDRQRESDGERAERRG